MNKGELVDAVAAKAQVTKKEADAVLTAAIDSIMEAVAAGDKVTLVGFGSFEPRQRAARDGRPNWQNHQDSSNHRACVFGREAI
jgi:DNA-binding protein HU-beta